MELNELIISVADETQYTRREIRTILRAIVKHITDGLASGVNVRIPKLGRFENLYAAPRSGRNRATGERFVIPASRRIKFVPTAQLRKRVKLSASLFETEEPATLYGLSEKGEEDDGEVRSRDRPEEGPQRKEGWGRRQKQGYAPEY